MIVEIGLAAIGAIAAADLGLTLRKRRPQVVQQAGFVCPYCDAKVWGNAREVELISHVPCIEDAKTRLAHEQAMAAEATRQAEIAAQETREREERQTRERIHAAGLKAQEKEAKRLRKEAEDKANENVYSISVWASRQSSLVHKKMCDAAWRVQKGGRTVDEGLSPDVVKAQDEAQAAVENHKAGKPPTGERMTSYTVA